MPNSRRSATRWLIPVLLGPLACLASTLVAAEQATVTTKDGRKLTGQLLQQTPETITLEISGIRTPIEMDTVESVQIGATVDEIYQQRKADLDPTDFDAGYGLAYFLFENKMYSAAKTELAELAKRFPDNDQIARLETVIDQRVKLLADPGGTVPVRPAARPTQPAGDQAEQPAPEDQLLTTEQVNLIRLWELPADLLGTQPRITIPKDAIREFLDVYRDHDRVPKGRTAQRDFLALKGYEQLDLLFQLRAREFYQDVIVRDDPPALAPFRRIINPTYVARFFRRHFGTGQVPDFYLIGRNPNGVAEAYTNFYILSETNINGAPMINRAEPEKSLLLQWGLPRDAASFPAPDVPGWRPFFAAGLDDPRFLEYVRWIQRLFNPKPNYGISFTLPQPPDPDVESP